MANLKWVDRIGETKEINGIEFTIVEVEPKGTGLIVQDNEINELHETTRSTWRNGKLANVLREIKKATMVKTKEVNGLLFEILEIAKNKFTIMVTGKDKLTGKEVEHMTEITKNVWEKGVFVKVFREVGIKIVRQLKRKKQQVTKYFLMVIKNITKTVTEETDSDVFATLRTTYDLKTLKHAYKKLSKQFHPDMSTGNVELFKLADAIYSVRKEALRRAMDSFDPEFDKEEWFREDVDMIEQSIKDNENINY